MARGAQDGRGGLRAGAPGLREALAVWGLHGVFVVLTFVTYWRLAPEETYNVSREGLAGGAGRALVELNYPVALAAIPIAVLCALRLRHRVASALAVLSVALCALVVVAVDKADLDARPVNALPALGVALAAGLTVWAVRDGGPGVRSPRLRGDPVRLGLAAVIALASVPWLFAEAGFYAPDPILADELSPDEPLAAVHLGSHHGTEGAVLALTALALSRATPLAGRAAARLSPVLALMLAYGVAIATEDLWHEQVVKRGSAAWRLPDMVLPSLGWGWLGIVVAAAAVEALWFRRER